MTGRLIQHTLIRPSRMIPPFQSSGVSSYFSCPLGNRLRFSVMGNWDVVAPIIRLFSCCRPPYITRSIMTLVIGVSVNAIARARMISYFSVEFLKRLKLTANPFRSIVNVAWLVWIPTALFYSQICPVGFAVFTLLPLSMFPLKIPSIFLSPASTAFCDIRRYIRSKNDFYCATVTDSDPLPATLYRGKGIKYAQVIDFLTSQILKDRHDAPPLGVLLSARQLSEVLSFGCPLAAQLV